MRLTIDRYLAGQRRVGQGIHLDPHGLAHCDARDVDLVDLRVEMESAGVGEANGRLRGAGGAAFDQRHVGDDAIPRRNQPRLIEPALRLLQRQHRLVHACAGGGELPGGGAAAQPVEARLRLRDLRLCRGHLRARAGHLRGRDGFLRGAVLRFRGLQRDAGILQLHRLRHQPDVGPILHLIIGLLRLLELHARLIHLRLRRGQRVPVRPLQRLLVGRARARQTGLRAAKRGLRGRHVARVRAFLELLELRLRLRHAHFRLAHRKVQVSGVQRREHVALLDRLARAGRHLRDGSRRAERQVDLAFGQHRARRAHRRGNVSCPHRHRLVVRRVRRGLSLLIFLVSEIAGRSEDREDQHHHQQLPHQPACLL